MKHRTWTSKQKSHIVLEGLSGKIDISSLCQKYRITQTQYYKWRDLFLSNCHQSFEVKKQSQKEQHLESQVKKLRSIIGDLTIEFKKSDYEL
ncbi:MAG: transposase [Candidatus Omnitrophica bacterium]|nr:transposase [Candidatus Omnitrophota bacterium]